MPYQSAMDGAVRHLVSNYNPKGNRIGWLMMASILVEAWDLYSIAFVLVFIRDQYHPDPLLLGLAAAGTQGGALIGALIGGWLSDKIGRRIMFLVTMMLFIVLALAQAFVPGVGWLIVIRFLLGVPLGSDISTGYTYIMESIANLRKDPIRWSATLYGWIACFAQASEFSTFAFYLPVLFAMVGVSSILGNNLVTMALFSFAAVSGWVGPLLTPKIGHRGISTAGFGIVLVSLLIAAAALYTDYKYVLPFAAAGMLWGHYWSASNCMTIPTMVAKPEYRGTASGFAYMFVK